VRHGLWVDDVHSCTCHAATKRDAQLQELLFFGLLERGVYIAARGMVNLGLPHTDDQLAQFLDAFAETLASLN
jgi:glutamate-1-semialdehyde 2,1-aminomutase